MTKQKAIDILAIQGVARCTTENNFICDQPHEHIKFATEEIEALEKAGMKFDD